MLWEEFIKESNWIQIISRFDLSLDQIMIIKVFFETACEKAKERLEFSVEQ